MGARAGAPVAGAPEALAPSFVEPGLGCSLSGLRAGATAARPLAKGPELLAELCVRRARACGVPSAPPRPRGAGREGPGRGGGSGPTRAGKPGCRVSVARQVRPPRAPRP